jgi:hypothetical protein
MAAYDYDKEKMSTDDYAKLQGYKSDWQKASEAGDTEAQQTAHDNAEALRKLYGYSGGSAGNEYNKYSTTDSSTEYDYADNVTYNKAMDALSKLEDSKPTYAGTYDSQLSDLYDKIVNRDKFSYDVSTDPIYQQYKQQYTTQGNLAMQDTMGQAAALTGGYGSSYSQAVGQQQYDAYLQQLNDVIPTLYENAYDRYSQEGTDLQNQYSMLGDLSDREYNKYADALSAWQTERNYQQGVASDAYTQGYNNWYNSQQLQQAQKEWDLTQEQWAQDQTEYADSQKATAYSNLVTLISNTGYSPTEDELTAAGMSASEAAAWLSYYNRTVGTSSSSGSSSSKSSSSSKKSSSSSSSSGSSDTSNKSTLTTAQISDMQTKYDAAYRIAYAQWMDSYDPVKNKTELEGKARQTALNKLKAQGYTTADLALL